MSRRSGQTRAASPSSEGLRILLMSLAAGFIVMLLLLLGMSLLMTKLGFSAEYAGALAAVALCAGCFAAGFVAAHAHHRNGLGTGLLSGLVVFGIFLAVSLFSGGSVGWGSLSRLLMVLASAGIGGVIGVNFRPRRY